MGLSEAFAALFTKAKTEAVTIEHAKWTSTRLIALVLFVGMLLWFTKGVLTSDLFHLTFKAIAVYTVCNTLTRITATVCGAWIRCAQLKSEKGAAV